MDDKVYLSREMTATIIRLACHHGRSPHEVMDCALRLLDWALCQQAAGRIVGALEQETKTFHTLLIELPDATVTN